MSEAQECTAVEVELYQIFVFVVNAPFHDWNFLIAGRLTELYLEVVEEDVVKAVEEGHHGVIKSAIMKHSGDVDIPRAVPGNLSDLLRRCFVEAELKERLTAHTCPYRRSAVRSWKTNPSG